MNLQEIFKEKNPENSLNLQEIFFKKNFTGPWLQNFQNSQKSGYSDIFFTKNAMICFEVLEFKSEESKKSKFLGFVSVLLNKN